MQDSKGNPINITTDISPYTIPRRLGEIMHQWLTERKIKYVRKYTLTENNNPVIVYGIFRRVPGDTKGNQGKTGAHHLGYKTYNEPNTVVESVQQVFTVDYDFKIYATSGETLDTIAWEFELHLNHAIQTLRSEISNFTMTFTQQAVDTNLMGQQQDEILRTTLLYTAQVPVTTTKNLIYIKRISETLITTPIVKTTNYLAGDDADTMYITPPQGLTVVGINSVLKKTSTDEFELDAGLDYIVEYDELGVPFIRWERVYGTPPSTGDFYKVNYLVSQVLKK